MEISLTSTEGLGRRMTVVLGSEVVEDRVKQRLNSLKGKVKLDGFRPGKVPLSVVEKRYGPSVRAEVSEEVLQESFREALAKEKVQPAGVPQIESANLEPGDRFEFTATFEVYPEVEVAIPEGSEVEKEVVTVSDEDIEAVIDRMRSQATEWSVAEREAQDGDQVNVDFLGKLDGEAFDGGEAKAFDVVIGSGSLVGEFEESLIGLKAGDEKTIDVTFPEDYGVEKLAGQKAQFDITVNEIKEAQLPEVDEAFAQRFGIETVETLREQVQANITREAENAAKNNLKNKVLEVLLESITFDVPKALVENEANTRMEKVKAQLTSGGTAMPEGINLDASVFEEPATRSVKVGLIVAEIIKANGITVTSDQLKQAVDELAETYEDPDEVKKFYFGSRERLADLEALLLEDLAIDWVVDKLIVKEVAVSASELLKSGQQGA